MELRPYQDKSIQDVRTTYTQGKKRVLLYVPTGGGKTECAIAVTKYARAKGKKVLFLCNRKDLVRQTVARFAKYGINTGVLQGKNTWRPFDELVVGSIQTLASRMKYGHYFDFDFLIVDEAHTCAGSKQYRELFRQWNNIPVLGLSATPFSKGLGAPGMFEDIVVGATIEELINQGFLVDVEAYAPSEPDLRGVKIVAGDYHEKQLGLAVDKEELIGDIVTHWLKIAQNRQTVCFATNIAHSHHIVEEFKKAGVSARHIDCYMKDEDKEAVLDAFARQEFKILSNVSILAEGWDCAATGCMILARPTRSLIRFIQMCGRILRPYEGKSHSILLDHSGTIARLGFPTDPLPLELDDGKKKDADKKNDKPVTTKICPKCHHVVKKSKRTCPKCNHEWVYAAPKSDIEVAPGELKKVVKMPQHAKQQIWSGLLTYGSQKGYARGWCAWAYKDLVGVWPRGLIDQCGPIPEVVQKHITYKQIKFAKSKQRRA